MKIKITGDLTKSFKKQRDKIIRDYVEKIKKEKEMELRRKGQFIPGKTQIVVEMDYPKDNFLSSSNTPPFNKPPFTKPNSIAEKIEMWKRKK